MSNTLCVCVWQDRWRITTRRWAPRCRRRRWCTGAIPRRQCRRHITTIHHITRRLWWELQYSFYKIKHIYTPLFQISWRNFTHVIVIGNTKKELFLYNVFVFVGVGTNYVYRYIGIIGATKGNTRYQIYWAADSHNDFHIGICMAAAINCLMCFPGRGLSWLTRKVSDAESRCSTDLRGSM